MSEFKRGMNRQRFYRLARILGVRDKIPEGTGHTRLEHPKMTKSVLLHKEITTEVVVWIRKIESNRFDVDGGYGPMKS